MKKSFKKVLSAILCVVLAVGCVPFAIQNTKVEATASKKITDYSEGDTFEFGYYPQSKVTDDSVISALNLMAEVDAENIKTSTASWTSYGYYTGNDDYYNAEIIAGDWMRYTDIVYGGNKYRGVVFDLYRPNETLLSSQADTTYQIENGYFVGTVYWFKFDPVTWRVLDPATGLVISENIIDSQAYNNFIYYYDGECYADKQMAYTDADGNVKVLYTNNYEKSSIRKWLNNDFLSTAFSVSQQNSIATTDLVNAAFDSEYSKFDSASTDDKIYLLSFDDAQNEEYGFSSRVDEKDVIRKATGSDYAKCQGLSVSDNSEYLNFSKWLLRSAGDASYNSCGVKHSGKIESYYETISTCYGVRPAMNFKTDVEIVQKPLVKEKIGDYEVGEILEFGYYPQSKVTDEATITALNEKAKVDSSDIATSTSIASGWTSYGYYTGTSDYDGQMTASDYMRYTDVVYGGNKYRGVILDSYRPYSTGYASSSNEQLANGYSTGTVYWFKYEPIQWRVLDPATGMVMSETILDSQEYNNYVIKSGDEYYGDKQLKYTDADGNEKDWFANNYEKSSIRKWLNDDFYNAAFSASQKNSIATTTLDNSAYTASRPQYDSATTNDKIYLLSYADTFKTSYGFSSSATASTTRNAQGSDYAKSQGLWVSTSSYSGSSYWRLRSAGRNSGIACRVGGGGSVGYNCVTDGTFGGIRPAMNFDTSVAIVQEPLAKEKIGDYDVGDTLEYGWYPQSKVTDSSIISQLNSMAGDNKSWTSYGYYKGSGTWQDGNMTASNYMRYTDVILGSNKYRGVIFDSYRPYFTGDASSADYSCQDDNGYSTGTVYWFKYEPVKWRVLDPATGMVMSETTLDSQAYNNYILYSDGEYYGDKQLKYTDADGNEKDWFANNYEKSSIRKWLNDDFYNTAFSASQKNVIATTTLDNSAYDTSYSKFDSATTNDKIYLLSYADVLKTNYGFSSSTSGSTTRTAQGSEYAKSQGLWVSTGGNSYWWRRSAGHNSGNTCGVDFSGCVYNNYNTSYTNFGVRPALNFDSASAITQCDVSQVGIANYTVETYTMNISGTYEKATEVLTGNYKSTVKAEYTVPTGFTLNETKSVLSGTVVSDGSLVLKVYLDRNKYALTTVVDGESTPTEYYYEQAISPVADPLKMGYEFNGWTPEIPATMPANALTVTAVFSEKSYVVAFNTDGGTEVKTKENVKWTDEVLDEVETPEKAGYTFTGWSAFRSGGKAVTKNSTYGDIDINDQYFGIAIYANWTENSDYIVTFNTDGGNKIPDKINVKWFDKVLDGVKNPEKKGYEFIGWYCGIDPVSADSTFGSLAAGSAKKIEITAMWKDIESPTIGGIDNGATYCDGKTFTVSDNGGIASVTANGKALTPDASGKYVLDSANGEVTVVVTDLEGNTQTVTVTVNDHKFCLGKCTECGEEEANACFLVKVFRYIVDWFTAFVKSCCVWLKEAPVSAVYWFIGIFTGDTTIF